MKHSIFLVLITATVVAAASANAAKKSKFYKWTDENGVVHYTQEPPPDQVQANEVTVRDLGPASAGVAGDDSGDEGTDSESETPDSMNERLAAEAEAYRRQAEILEERQKQVRRVNCEQGRALIAALEPSLRTVIRNPDGTQRIVSGDDRIAELNKARKMVADNCE